MRLARRSSRAPGSVRLWQEGIGAAALYEQHDAIPSHLPDDYQVLTRLGRIRYALSGLLARQADVLRQVLRWPAFRQKVRPGQAVDAEHTFAPLRSLLPAAAVAHIEDLKLAEVLDWMFSVGRMAPPELANALGQVVRERVLGNAREQSEVATLRQWLAGVEFRGCDGNYHSPRSLLIGHVGETDNEDRFDERMRAAFAPKEAVLDPAYEGPALEFFELCRKTLAADAKRMAEWVIAAEGKRRRDALIYLADGRLHKELQDALCRRGYHDTWLAQLRSSGVFREISLDQQYRLAQLLGPLRTSSSDGS